MAVVGLKVIIEVDVVQMECTGCARRGDGADQAGQVFFGCWHVEEV